MGQSRERSDALDAYTVIRRLNTLYGGRAADAVDLIQDFCSRTTRIGTWNHEELVAILDQAETILKDEGGEKQ